MSDSRTETRPENHRQADHPIDPQFLARWSPRALSGEPIEPAALLSLLEAARWAPSAFNAQPWRFLWAHRETPGWTRIFDTLVPFNQGWVARAAALVVVLSVERSTPAGQTEPKVQRSHAFDAGAAWASLALQASRSGWVAHAMTGFDVERLGAALQVPEGTHVQAVVAIGRQGDKSLLPEGLQAREAPNDRLPLGRIAAEVGDPGGWPFEA